MTDTITIRITDDMRKELMAVSKSENKSVSDIVRESLKQYIAVSRFRGLRETVLPYAEAQDIYTDEDVFRKIS